MDGWRLWRDRGPAGAKPLDTGPGSGHAREMRRAVLMQLLNLMAAGGLMIHLGAAPSDSRIERIEALFAEWDQPGAPGCAVGIVREGEVLHCQGYGLANLEHGIAITPQTVFDVASVSKQFAGMAIAMLVREGKLSLDEEVRELIEDLPDFRQPITVRHLVHHTSGMRDWPGLFAVGGTSFEDVISFERILGLARRQRELNFEPGAEYLYSNTGYNLLARIVEEVGGLPFAAWTERNIFEPLGMERTRFHDDHGRIVPNRAGSYAPRAGGGYRNVGNQLTALGSSSLYSTIEDLCKWLINFDRGEVGGTEVLELMRERGTLNDGSPVNYGFGLGFAEYRGLKVEQHTGSWAGFRTILVHYPEHRFGLVILGNVTSLNTMALARRLADIYLEEYLQPLPEETATSGSSGSTGSAAPEPSHGSEPEARDPLGLQDYEGEYNCPELEAVYQVRVEGETLVARQPGRAAITLSRQGPDRFEGSAWFFREVVFDRNEREEVVGFRVNSGRVRNLRFDRVGD